MTAYEIILRLSLILASLVGIYVCFCFAQGLLAKLVPKLGTVHSVVTLCKDTPTELTKWDSLLGVPNWWLGSIFYILIILSTIWTNVWVVTFALLGTMGACVISLILIYGLIFSVKKFCKMCYLAHIANFAILILWIIAIWQATNKPY